MPLLREKMAQDKIMWAQNWTPLYFELWATGQKYLLKDSTEALA